MRTLMALYRTVDDAESTIRALEAAGISHENVGLLMSAPTKPAPRTDEAASGAKTGAALGAVFGGGAGILASLGTVTVPGFGLVLAAGWWVAAVAGAAGGAAAGGATGGLVGKLVELGLTDAEAHRRVEDIEQGAILLTVEAEGPKATAAEAILSKYHPLERGERTAALER